MNQGVEWEATMKNLRVVKLTLPIEILVPSLLLPGVSKKTRGASFFPGMAGATIGAVLLAASFLLGLLIGRPYGVIGWAVPFWLLGSTGIVMVVSGIRPLAFVKPICTGCRLLPVIKEHEAIHLSGVSGEKEVWASMRTRHTIENLGLRGDPAICTFCPIPKRLAEG